MENSRVDKYSGNGSKGKAVCQSKGGGKEQGRIGFILGQIQREFVAQNFADIIKVPSIVVALRVADGKVIRVPSTRKVNTDRSDDEERDDSNHGIRNRVPGRNQGAVSVRTDLRPVKGDGNQGHTRPSSEKLIDDDVIGTDPTSKAEHAQEWRNEAWEPVPKE